MKGRNPFRDNDKRKKFDTLIKAFLAKDSKMLFNRDGSRNRGNSFAATFWAGYDGVTFGPNAPIHGSDKNGIDYVFYKAGQAAKEIDPE